MVRAMFHTSLLSQLFLGSTSSSPGYKLREWLKFVALPQFGIQNNLALSLLYSVWLFTVYPADRAQYRELRQENHNALYLNSCRKMFFIFKAQYLTILSVFLMSLFILVICHLKFFRCVERKWTMNIRDDLDQIETCSIFIKSLYMLTNVYF